MTMCLHLTQICLMKDAWESFPLYQKKKTSSIKQSYIWDSDCTSTIVVSHDPLSPTPPSSSAMKTPENTEDPDEP